MTRSFVAAGLLALAACAGGSSADTVITDGMVWTGLSSGDARAGAVAIRDLPDDMIAVGVPATELKR